MECHLQITPSEHLAVRETKDEPVGSALLAPSAEKAVRMLAALDMDKALT